MARKVIVLGAGFSGLSAAAYLSRQGFKVEILEKNAHAGGRAGMFEADGFRFNLGPEIYWLPEVFERFFAHFDSHPSNYYELKRYAPALRVFSEDNEYFDVPCNYEELVDFFEANEKGSGKKLIKFYSNAEKLYRLAMNKLLYKPGKSVFEYANPGYMLEIWKTQALRPIKSYTRSLFKNKRLQAVLEYPFLFLGSNPQRLPSIFHLTNFANTEMGTWYPKGGMYSVVEAMQKVCVNFDVDITYHVNVDQLDVLKGKVISAHFSHRNFYGEYFVSSADYYHTDNQLLAEPYGNYSEKSWNKKTLGPSALIFYLGINKNLQKLEHLNMVTGANMETQMGSFTKHHVWPENPSFFVSAASKSDETAAPAGHENIKVTIPVPSGLIDPGKIRDHYYHYVIDKLEQVCGTNISDHIVFHKSYAHTDFINDFNAFKGNGFGLANVPWQLANRRCKIINKNLPNLFYTGHYCVPGPGVPTAIISGEIVAREIYRASGGKKN
jgi:phytoene desaturase